MLTRTELPNSLRKPQFNQPLDNFFIETSRRYYFLESSDPNFEENRKLLLINGLPVENVENLLVVIVPAQLGDLVQQREQHRVELKVEPMEGYLSTIKEAAVASAVDA